MKFTNYRSSQSQAENSTFADLLQSCDLILFESANIVGTPADMRVAPDLLMDTDVGVNV